MISSYGDNNDNICDHDDENICIIVNQGCKNFPKVLKLEAPKADTKQVPHSRYANIGRHFTKFNSPDACDLYTPVINVIKPSEVLSTKYQC